MPTSTSAGALRHGAHMQEAVVEGRQLRRHALGEPWVLEDLRDAGALGRHGLQHPRQQVPARLGDLQWHRLIVKTCWVAQS